MNITPELKRFVKEKYNALMAKKQIEQRNKKNDRVCIPEMKKYNNAIKKIAELQTLKNDIIRKLDSKEISIISEYVNNEYVYHAKKRLSNHTIMKMSYDEVMVKLQYTESEDVLKKIEEIFKKL